MGNNDVNENIMIDRQYIKIIKRACIFRELKTNKYLHYGRETKLAMLEMEETHQDNINALGNWCKDVFTDIIPVIFHFLQFV